MCDVSQQNGATRKSVPPLKMIGDRPFMASEIIMRFAEDGKSRNNAPQARFLKCPRRAARGVRS